ncbi:hypothetical protein [Amycolatopsis sp. H20-H5]|uniref:hypothetical protein n=1 Tax=Amycolatopsis sp. H20-H5 TaxID=3046309 RepID=UPI002DBDC678|nr:hypothetical protein [Amycolatopsis sp. H20-H5]MEC3976515.1 hypothetical protein [Amycolatopsis sp. H20-H5]
MTGAVALSVLMAATGCSSGAREGHGRIVHAAAGSGDIPHVPTAPPSPTSTPPPAPQAPETHSGKGNAEVAITWPDRIGFVTFECPKCGSNVMVDSDGGDYGLVNAIGSYKGTHWLNSLPGHPATKLTVRATADWTFTIADGRDLPVAEPGKTLSGTGDAVVSLPGKTATAEITAKGKGHFSVMLMPADHTAYTSLPVNTSGGDGYHGTVPLAGPGLLQLDADSSWTITPA